MKEYDKLIFEISRPGRKGYELPADRYATDGLGAIPASLRPTRLWICPRSASWMW